MNWPMWWDWELEISPHVEKRMEERTFTEIDLREMLQRAHAFELDEIEGLCNSNPTSTTRLEDYR